MSLACAQRKNWVQHSLGGTPVGGGGKQVKRLGLVGGEVGWLHAFSSEVDHSLVNQPLHRTSGMGRKIQLGLMKKRSNWMFWLISAICAHGETNSWGRGGGATFVPKRKGNHPPQKNGPEKSKFCDVRRFGNSTFNLYEMAVLCESLFASKTLRFPPETCLPLLSKVSTTPP